MSKLVGSHRFENVRVRTLSLAVVAALGQGAIGASALAQGSVPLEEVVVTASRRATSVQDVPFNIAAIGGDTLEHQRLRSQNSFARWVPGLTVVDQGARATNLMTVRGLNVMSLNGTEFLGNSGGETVQTYLGDIPLFVDLRLHDIDRVEVLIGPQGTLYGASTLGGAVRYIPRAPDATAFSIDTHGDVYSVAHGGTGFEGNVAINAPIIEDRLAVRASVGWYDDPGFIDYVYVVREPGVSDPSPDFSNPADVAANLHRVNDANWSETVSGRVALSYHATDRVTATFNYYFQDQQSGGRSINHRDALGVGRYESGHRVLEPNDRDNRLFSAEVVADLGFAELTSATGVSEYNEVGQRDQTDLLLGFGYGQFPSFIGYTRDASTEERVNQELRLVSTGSGRWSWIGGLFYNEFKADANSQEFVPGFPEFAGIDVPTGDLEYRQLTQREVTERALFGEVTYRFTDRWHGTLGMRLFEYDDFFAKSFDLPLWEAFGEREITTASDDGVLGKLNVAYDLSDSALAYLTISEGYRLGGMNPIDECEDPLPPGQSVCASPDEILIEPDRTTNYELGVRSAFASGRINLNAAVYYIDWDKIQTLSRTEVGAALITVNGGSARSRGVELSLQARTAGPWSFRASYGYADAALTSDAPGLVDGADAFDGDRLAGTPEHQGSFFADYSRRLRNGLDLNVGYGLTFSSNVLTKVGGRNDGETLGGYTVHHAQVAVGRDGWTATLYADNLFDKFAETGVRQDRTFIGEIDGHPVRRYFRNVLRPRVLGMEFRYRFGG